MNTSEMTDWFKLFRAVLSALAVGAFLALDADAQDIPAEAVQDVPVEVAAPDQPQASEEFRRRGRQALADGIHSAAARFFTHYREEVAGEEPMLADATALLVEALYRAGRLDDAEEALDFHAATSPGLTEDYYRDRLAYWRAAVAFQKGESEGPLAVANDLLARHVEANDIRVSALELKGAILARARQWDEAERVFRAIMEEFSVDPDDATRVYEAKIGLAEVLKDSGQTREALALLAELAADDQAPLAVRTRAHLRSVGVYIARNEMPQALATYAEIAIRQPKIPDASWFAAVSELFNALAKAELHDEAVNLVPGLLSLTSDEHRRFQILLGEATVLLAAGRLRESEEKLDALRENRGETATDDEIAAWSTTAFQLADAYVKEDAVERAVERFRLVVDEERAEVALRHRAAINLGALLTALEQHEEAVRAYADAARLANTPERQSQALFEAGEAAFRKAEIGGRQSPTFRSDYGRAASFYKNVVDNFPEGDFVEKAMFHLGLSRSRAGLHQDAAQVLRQFGERFPESEFSGRAMWEHIRALRHSGEHDEAMEVVARFAETHAGEPLVASALMEGFQMAKQALDYPRANGFLGLLVESADVYADTGLVPHALYERAHLGFLFGKTDVALADAELFLQRYPLLPLAADVRLWLADHYAGLAHREAMRGDNGRPPPPQAVELYEKALRFYLDVDVNHASSPQARQAVYEAARINHWLERTGTADDLLTKLLTQFAPDATSRLRGMAAIQLADIRSQDGRFSQAARLYRQAEEYGEDPDVVFVARGRRADMKVSQAGILPEDAPEIAQLLNQAVELYLELATREDVGPTVREGALFKAGRTLAMLGDAEGALEKYLTVFYDFADETGNGAMRSWHYFTRAGFAAGDILVAQGKYEQALRCFTRLAESGVPTAPEAQARAEHLRDLIRR